MVRGLWVLMVTAFVDTLGAFLVIALLPFYAERFGASAVEVTLLVSAFHVAQMLTTPLWGRWSDRTGRRPLILAGLALSAIAYWVFAVADSLWLLLLSRLAQGVGGGTVSVVFAYVSDSLPPEKRAAGLGWVSSATSLAAVVGPAVGSFSGRWSPRAPGFITGGLCIVTLLIAAAFLTEPQAGDSGQKRPPAALSRSIWRVLRHPQQPAHSLIWIYAAGMFVFTAVTAIIGLFLERRFQVTENDIWIFFSYLGGMSMVVRLLALGPLVERFGEAALVRWGGLLLGLSTFCLPLPSTLSGLAAAVCLLPIGSSLLFPPTTALVSRHTPADQGVGQMMGVQQAIGGVSRIAAPIAAGFLFERWGASVPFLVTGTTLVAVVATSLLVKLRPPASPA